jgi:hypothetical protein
MKTEIKYFSMPYEPGLLYIWSQRAHDGWTHVYIIQASFERLRKKT